MLVHNGRVGSHEKNTKISLRYAKQNKTVQRFSLGVKQRTNSDDSVPPPGSLLSVLPRVHGLHVTVGQNVEREGEKETSKQRLSVELFVTTPRDMPLLSLFFNSSFLFGHPL